MGHAVDREHNLAPQGASAVQFIAGLQATWLDCLGLSTERQMCVCVCVSQEDDVAALMC